MFETTLFLAALLLTVLAMCLTVRAGMRARRREHIGLAISTVVFLCLTVVFAYLLPGVRDLPEDWMHIHRYFSKSVALILLPVVVTGILLWRGPRWRTAHRIAVVLFLFAVLGAAVTGGIVLWNSALLPA